MHNSVIQDQEKLNHSKKMGTDGSTAMTIDFLRARLLSERSISRSARQRADELAKKVVELEDQLKLVTLQRKKAEKATSEVLAILENHGISDLSEVYDSSSDQDGVSSESKVVNNLRKEDINLTTSRATRVKVEESSGLQLGVFPLIGRSLSWKSGSDSPNSLESARCLEKTRRHSSFVSTDGSSTRNHLGKSCRQIKQRETRSLEAEVNDESLFLDTQENVAANRSGDADCITDIPKILNEDNKNEEEKLCFGNSLQSSLEDQRKEANNVLVLDGNERNAEMERALEHQARLIGQFEAEENAQREWEEKFKGNNCYSPDSCEQGNHSDITEERDEIRAETSEALGPIPSPGQGGKSGMEQACDNGEAMTNNLPKRFFPHPHHDNGYAQEHQPISSTGDQSQNSYPEFSFPGREDLEAKSNEKQKPEWSENNSNYSTSYASPEHKEAQFSSFHGGGSYYKGESSGNSLQVATNHENRNALGGVLDALQQAKLSLKHELSRLASSTRDGSVVRKTEPPALAITAGDAMDIPVGCAGLFRVPTSSEFETLAKPSFSSHYPDSESSLSRYYSGSRVGSGAESRYSSRPYSDRGSRVGSGADSRYSSRPYSDRGLVNSTHGPLIDPYIHSGMGLPSASRYFDPLFVDLMPRASSNDGFSRTFPSMGFGMPSEDRYSEYNHRIRSDVYKRY